MKKLSAGDGLFRGYRLVLASNSPRRRELLEGLGLDFEVRVLDGVDESYPACLDVAHVPEYISRVKADAYLDGLECGELLITADTIVTIDGIVLGKPSDAEDAKRMLRLLSGRRHQVITGVTLATAGRSRSFSVVTGVTFSQLTEDEIEYYVSEFRPLDKAGAYGIQEWIGYIGVERIEGSYFNVVGLPVDRLYRELENFCRYSGSESR